MNNQQRQPYGNADWLADQFKDHASDVGSTAHLLTGRSFGPIVSGVAKTGIGSLLGIGAAHLMAKNPERRKKLMKTLGILGGGLGAGWGAIDSMASYKLRDHPQMKQTSDLPWYLNPYPYGREKASSDAFGPLVPSSDVPDWAPAGWESPMTVDTLSRGISEDRNLTGTQKSQALGHIGFADLTAQKGGLVTTTDLVRAGTGYWGGKMAGAAAGKVLGALGVLPSRTQSKLAKLGAWGGLLRATGIWQ